MKSDFIKEFFHSFLHLFSLLSDPFINTDKVSSNKGPIIVLIGGWVAPNFFYMPFKRRLEKEGFTVYFPDFGWKLKDIRSYSEKLEEYINNKGLNNFYLIGHSMGGLIAMDYWKANKEKVKRVVVCATPLRGVSPKVKLILFSKSVRQMSKDSEFLKSMELPKDLIAIAVRKDQRISFRSAAPQEVDCLVFDGYGHYKPVFSKEIFDEIKKILR